MLVEENKEQSLYHNHDFYELIFILSDNIIHFVNDEQTRLPKSSLVFIRPEDKHSFSHNNDYSFLNIASDEDTYHLLKAYINDERMFVL